MPLAEDREEPSHVKNKPHDGKAWMHVDSGATVLVTSEKGELHHPMPTEVSCGTAAEGRKSSVTNIGSFAFTFETLSNDEPPTIVGPNTCEIPSF